MPMKIYIHVNFVLKFLLRIQNVVQGGGPL